MRVDRIHGFGISQSGNEIEFGRSQDLRAAIHRREEKETAADKKAEQEG